MPPPPEKVLSWPLIGEKVHGFWVLATENLKAAMATARSQVKRVLTFVGSRIAGAAFTVILSLVTVAPIVFAFWCLLVSVSDGVLKPLFLGRGVAIPMPVILLGAIGGMLLSGIIGLFVGAVVLSIGYSLFQAWMHAGPAEP